jgi:hypothetical protein
MSKTFQPDSLHPYIMDARLKKATGSGGISNIPIASADTLGGVMIGDGISVDADGAISGIAYSTTEHKTGRKWIDNKDIYEKTIYFAALPNESTVEEPHGISYDKIINISGSAFNDTYSMPVPYVDVTPTASIKVIMNSTNLIIQTGSDRHDYTAYVTIQYTKPTTP